MKLSGMTTRPPLDSRPRSDFRQPFRYITDQPRNAAENSARQHRRERITAHLQTTDDRASSGRKLASGTAQNFGRNRVTLVHGALHKPGNPRNGVAVDVAVVNLVDELFGCGQIQVLEDHRRQQRRGSPAIELPDDSRQRRTPDPEAAALVTQEITPSAGARRPTGGIASVRD